MRYLVRGLVLFFSCLALFAHAQTLQITSPNGGEVVRAAQPMTVTFTTSLYDEFDISFSSNGGVSWFDWYTTLAGQTSLQVYVPDYPGPNTLLRVRSHSTPTLQDVSDGSFTIMPQFAATTLPLSWDMSWGTIAEGWRILSHPASTPSPWTFPVGSDRYIYADSSTSNVNRIVWAPAFSTMGRGSVNFWFQLFSCNTSTTAEDTLQVLCTMDDGDTWSEIGLRRSYGSDDQQMMAAFGVGSFQVPPLGKDRWIPCGYALPGWFMNQPHVRIGFRASANGGPAICIDNLLVNTEAYHYFLPEGGEVYRAGAYVPLQFVSLASQPAFVTFYHTGAEWVSTTNNRTINQPMLARDYLGTSYFDVKNASGSVLAISPTFSIIEQTSQTLPLTDGFTGSYWDRGYRVMNIATFHWGEADNSFANRMLFFPYSLATGEVEDIIWTPPFSTVGSSTTDVSFNWHCAESPTANNEFTVVATINDGQSWTVLGSKYSNGIGDNNLASMGASAEFATTAPPSSRMGITRYTLPLAYQNQSAVRIGFIGRSTTGGGSNLYIDNLRIETPVFSISTPLPNESWQARSQQVINWSTNDLNYTASGLEYYSPTLQSWITLLTGTLTAPLTIRVPDYPGPMQFRLSGGWGASTVTPIIMVTEQNALPFGFFDGFDNPIEEHGFRSFLTASTYYPVVPRVYDTRTGNWVLNVPLNGIEANASLMLPPVTTVGASNPAIEVSYSWAEQNPATRIEMYYLTSPLGVAQPMSQLTYDPAHPDFSAVAGTGGDTITPALSNWGKWRVLLPAGARNQAWVRIILQVAGTGGANFYLDDISLYNSIASPADFTSTPSQGGFSCAWGQLAPGTTGLRIEAWQYETDQRLSPPTLFHAQNLTPDVTTYPIPSTTLGYDYFQLKLYAISGMNVSAEPDTNFMHSYPTTFTSPLVTSTSCTSAVLLVTEINERRNNAANMGTVEITDLISGNYLWNDGELRASPYAFSYYSFGTLLPILRLSPATDYRFQVNWRNEIATASDFSTPRYLTAPINARHVFPLTGPDNDSLTIAWEGTDPATTGYTVYRTDDGGITYSLVATVADTFFVDINVTPDTRYFYRVYSYSPTNFESPTFLEFSIATGCTQPPAPLIVSTTYSYLSVQLSNAITAPNPASTEYYIQVSLGTGFVYVDRWGLLTTDFAEKSMRTLSNWMIYGNIYLSELPFGWSGTVQVVAINSETWEQASPPAPASVVTPVSLPLVENFSGTQFPPNNWVIGGRSYVANGWQRYTGANSNNGCATIDFYHLSNLDQEDHLITPAFSTLGYSSVSLEFDWSYVNPPAGFVDSLYVEAYTTNNNSITQIHSMIMRKFSFGPGSEALAGGTNGSVQFPSPDGMWGHFSCLLPAEFVNKTGVQLYINGNNGNGSALFVDNIRISNATPQPPVNLRITYAAGVVTLNWDPPASGSFTEYHLWRSNTAYFTPPASGFMFAALPAGLTNYSENYTGRSFYRITTYQGATDSEAPPVPNNQGDVRQK